MKIFLLTLLVSVFGLNTFAGTFGIFASTGDSVKIIVQGNHDALKLFDSLLAEANEVDGNIKKHVTVESSSFETIYEIICNKSIRTPNLASCTISLDGKYSWARIDKSNKAASVVPYGDLDTYASYSEFIAPDENNIIFLSSDNQLKISVEKNAYGDIFRFRLEFKQNNL